MTWSNVPGGSYSVMARATDNAGASNDSSSVSFRVSPPNDNFTNRISLKGSPVTTNGWNNGASTETGEPYHYSSRKYKSVWWAWTAPASGTVTISTIGSNFNTILSVYTGTSVSALTRIANDNDSGGNTTSRVSFSAVAGTVYQIAVDSYSSSISGNIQLNITMP